VLGVFYLLANKAPHNIIASLVVTIKDVMGNLETDTMAKACRRIHSRIEAVVEANGYFFYWMVNNAHDFHIFYIQ